MARGTVLDGYGVRHEAVGLTSAQRKYALRSKTYTTCGRYFDARVNEDETLPVTCIQCITRYALGGVDDILRGVTEDMTMIDEAQGDGD